MPSYNNPNDVLNLAQRIYMNQPNLGNVNTNNLLMELEKLSNQSLSQPGLGIQGIDDITKARALNKLLGAPDYPQVTRGVSNRDAVYDQLGIKMYQDLNNYNYSPEDDYFYSDPDKYFYAADVIDAPYIPMSALYRSYTSSNDFPPIETSVIRPHLNTALGKWYLMNGGKI